MSSALKLRTVTHCFIRLAVILCLCIALTACNRPGPAGGDDGGVTTATFAAEVEEHDKLVLVDFWAPWCSPCRKIAPALKRLSVEFEGQVKFTKVNVDHNQELARRFQINSIPCLILFRDGKAIDLRVGAASEETYREWLKQHLEDSAA